MALPPKKISRALGSGQNLPKIGFPGGAEFGRQGEISPRSRSSFRHVLPQNLPKKQRGFTISAGACTVKLERVLRDTFMTSFPDYQMGFHTTLPTRSTLFAQCLSPQQVSFFTSYWSSYILTHSSGRSLGALHPLHRDCQEPPIRQQRFRL
jgi:hypothetical protein